MLVCYYLRRFISYVQSIQICFSCPYGFVMIMIKSPHLIVVDPVNTNSSIFTRGWRTLIYIVFTQFSHETCSWAIAKETSQLIFAFPTMLTWLRFTIIFSKETFIKMRMTTTMKLTNLYQFRNFFQSFHWCKCICIPLHHQYMLNSWNMGC